MSANIVAEEIGVYCGKCGPEYTARMDELVPSHNPFHSALDHFNANRNEWGGNCNPRGGAFSWEEALSAQP